MKTKSVLVLLLALFFTLSACNAEQPTPAQTPAEPYDDIRGYTAFDFDDISYYFEEGMYDPKDIPTFTFNELTVLEGSEDILEQVMEEAKNPGLGVRDLHERGITGEGVNVAIIDQNLLLNHPEFEGKIAAYHDTGCEVPEGTGSMHAPAVVSLLVGETIGVAPGAKVYFAAAPSWTADSKFQADALYWVIEQNEALPEDEKIRVVSISAAPSGYPFTENTEMWQPAVEAAQQAGIMVIDCRGNFPTGFIASAYLSGDDREDPTQYKAGWPDMEDYGALSAGNLAVPCSLRTVAEEYIEGEPSFQYTGVGGLSWGIPYAAGVCALGWQVNPELSAEQMKSLLLETAAIGADFNPIINPPAFIEAVEQTLE